VTKAELIQQAKERAEKATPGPWDTLGGLVRAIRGDLAVPLFRSEAPFEWHKNKNLTHKVMCAAYADEVNNAAFIAFSRAALPQLATALEQAEEENQKLREALRAAHELLRGDSTERGWDTVLGHLPAGGLRCEELAEQVEGTLRAALPRPASSQETPR
jgi:hypothetical protein